MTKSSSPPQKWVRTTIGKLFRFEYGTALKKSDRIEDGKYPVFGSNGIVGQHNDYLVEGPALIVGRKGSAGEVTACKENCWPIDTTYYVKVPEQVDFGFALYLLKGARLQKLEKSTAIPGLNRNDAYEIEVWLPPLNEQRRIIAKIDELFSHLDQGVKNLKHAQALLKVYHQALLKAAFSGRLTEKWREENAEKLETANQLLTRIKAERESCHRQQLEGWRKEMVEWEGHGKHGKKPTKPQRPKNPLPFTEAEIIELPNLPEGWAWVRSGALLDFVTSGSRGWAKFYAERGAVFLRITNLSFNSLHLDLSPGKVQYVSLPPNVEGLRTRVTLGDFLFSITGYIGMFAIAPELEEAYVNQHIALARPADGYSKSYFGYYITSTSGGRHHLERMTKGAVKAGLGLDDIQNIPISNGCIPRLLKSPTEHDE